MRKNKILIVGPVPRPYTGMSVATAILLNSSLRDKFEVIHLDTSDKRAVGAMGKLELINIMLAFIHSCKFIWLYIRKKPDLVYLLISQNLLGYLRDALFLIPCRILNIKVVVHLHGGYFRNFYNDSNILMKKIINFTLRKVSMAIVLGECLRYIFKDLVPEEKIVVISNGVDNYFSKDTYQLSDKKDFKILFLSNFFKEKGILEILKVIPNIVSSYKNVKFVFAGEWTGKGEERKIMGFIKESKIEAYVEFVGIVGGATKKSLLAEANLFILPTFYPFEGQPLTILEAMSAGLPVISTRRGAIAETVIDGENGFLVEPKNSTQLIEKVVTIISHPELCEELGRRSRARYLEKYTKDIFVNNLVNIFLKVLEESALKSRVLIVGYLPPPQEGTAKITETIVNSTYLINNFQMEFLSLLKSETVKRGKFGLLNLIYNGINLLKYVFFIFTFRPQIIYMPLAQNTFGFTRDSMFILTGKLFRKKIYIHFHGGNFDLFYKSKTFIFRKYIGFVLRYTDCAILLAKKFADQFLPFIERKKITFLYNCLPDSSILLSKGNKRIYFDKRIKKVLFIGYLSKAKGALDLVQTIPSVIKKYNRTVEFILCGHPLDIERNIVFIPDPHFGYSKIKRFIAEENISRYAHIYPEVLSTEKEKMFMDADIFVFPSYSEGCGLVVLEAMAYGLPIITTPVGALEEMLIDGHNCLFVNPGDVRGISEKILFLLNNPSLCQKMGEDNMRLIKERYNQDIFINKLAQVWSSMEI